MQNIINRFISYVTIDTESDPYSTTTPSTAKQFDLANLLVEELKQIGMKDVTIDTYQATLQRKYQRLVSSHILIQRPILQGLMSTHKS